MLNKYYNKSKYEILAIFREEYRVKSTLVLNHQGNVFKSTLQKIDVHYFSMELTSFTPLQHVEYAFILHSQLGKIEFSTYLLLGEMENKSKHPHRFKIPEKIKISQRRVFPRIILKNNPHFYLSGHYENGDSYRFIINDLSEGGVSFIANSSQSDSINKGAVFNNIVIILGEYGSILTSIKVVSVTNLQAEQILDLNKVRVSCSFHNASTETQKFLENVMLQLTIDKKNKARRF